MHASGGVVSPANPLYTSYELRNQIEKSGSTIVFSHVGALEVVKEAIKGLNVTKVVVLEEPDVPTPETFEGFDCAEVVGLDDLCASASGLISEVPAHVAKAVGTGDLALLPYSSGTTGLPKGTMLSHNNVSINIQQVRGGA